MDRLGELFAAVAAKQGLYVPVEKADKVDFARCLLEWLSYGRLRGIGQWRNGGWGQFACRVTDPKTGEVLLDTLG